MARPMKKTIPDKKVIISPKKILGAVECCSLPTLHLPLINAKIDTGAKTSALHASEIEKFTKNKQSWVRFSVFPIQKTMKIKVICKAPIVAERNVTSSSGQTEKRIVISTLIKLAGVKQEVELTLSTNRNRLSYRMLLGRSAMKGFFVNPTKSYCQGRIRKKEALLLYPENTL
jgi:ribosomal protein S6--L-glutamate ligase